MNMKRWASAIVAAALLVSGAASAQTPRPWSTSIWNSPDVGTVTGSERIGVAIGPGLERFMTPAELATFIGGGGGAGVGTFNGRAGTVTLLPTDVGGAVAATAPAHQFFNTLPSNGVFGAAQPAIGDLQNITQATLLGNNTGLPGPVLPLSGTQATALLNDCSTLLKGLVPTPPNNANLFLRGDCTFAVVPGSGGANVSGPASSVVGDFALFGNTSGTLISDGGVGIGTSGNALGKLNANLILSGNDQFTGGVEIGTPTGGMPLAGSLNAQGLQVGGVNVLVATSAAAGDCTGSLSALTCTKTNGVAFAASATTDATNAANINSGVLAAARLPAPTVSTLGGVKSFSSPSHQYVTGIDLTGLPTAAQPVIADLQNIPALSVLGNNVASSGPVIALTQSQLTTLINTCTATAAGLVPTPPNSTTLFLRGDCQFATPPGGGNVSGPGASTNTDVATWNGSTGTIVADSGLAIANVARLNANDQFTGAIEVGSPTGGMPAAGTVNAQGLQVNGAPVLTGTQSNVALIGSYADANIQGFNMPGAKSRRREYSTGDVAFSPKLVATIQPNVVSYAKLQQVNALSLVANPTGSLATAQNVTLGATLTFSGTALQTNAFTGDVTTSANSFATTIGANAVTNTKLAQAAANTMKGNWTSVTANVADNAMPSCSDSAGNHLNYVSGTGITCGSTSSASGVGSVNSNSSNLVFSPTTGNVVGTVTTPINLQGTSPYAITGGTNSDGGKLIETNAAGTFALTLSAATTSGFGAGYGTAVLSLNAAGVTTVTPTTSTINGGTSLTLPPLWTAFVQSDGTNYQAPVVETSTGKDTITAHAGGGQASATALWQTNNNVTTVASAGDSVKLLPSFPGMHQIVTNSGANAMQVFGSGTDTINGVATGTGVSQGAGVTTVYNSPAGGKVFSTQLAPNGTVSSVALSVPSFLSVAGSPITGAGTLAVTAAGGQPQNQLLATPNGSSGALAVRALVLADFPSIGANTVLGNNTAGSTTPLAMAMPSCGTTSNALTWTPATGFGCNTISGSGTVNSGGLNTLAVYTSAGVAVTGVSPGYGITVSSTAVAAPLLASYAQANIGGL